MIKINWLKLSFADYNYNKTRYENYNPNYYKASYTHIKILDDGAKETDNLIIYENITEDMTYTCFRIIEIGKNRRYFYNPDEIMIHICNRHNLSQDDKRDAETKKQQEELAAEIIKETQPHDRYCMCNRCAYATPRRLRARRSKK